MVGVNDDLDVPETNRFGADDVSDEMLAQFLGFLSRLAGSGRPPTVMVAPDTSLTSQQPAQPPQEGVKEEGWLPVSLEETLAGAVSTAQGYDDQEDGQPTTDGAPFYARRRPSTIRVVEFDPDAKEQAALLAGLGIEIRPRCSPLDPNEPAVDSRLRSDYEVYNALHQAWIPFDVGDFLSLADAHDCYPIVRKKFHELYEPVPREEAEDERQPSASN